MDTQTKKCFVPACNSNTKNSPDLIFITVPQDRNVRKLWYEAIGVTSVPKSKKYCCEKHFNLEEDASNWMHYKLMASKLRLKPNIVPHLLLTPSKQQHFKKQLTSSAKKRKQKNLEAFHVAEVLRKPDAECSNIISPSKEGSSGCSRNLFGVAPSETLPFEQGFVSLQSSSVQDLNPSTSAQKQLWRTQGTQYNYKVSTKSVAIGTEIVYALKRTMTPAVSQDEEQEIVSLTSSSEERQSTNTDEYLPSTSSSSSTLTTQIQQAGRNIFYEHHVCILEKRPLFYLGLPKDAYFIVKLCSEQGHISTRDVLLTLKKIRRGDEYSRLADDFCISTTTVGTAFRRTVPLMAKLLQDIIFWPRKEEIQKLLPISFRSRFYQVQSIIDCFEIQIEKPSNPLNQALTWSQYYKCNTIKYMVSATPNGIVNFISPGFGGRTSDKNIVEESGFLNVIPQNIKVMADRGFKHVEQSLMRHGCSLVRPPSVTYKEKPTKLEVKAGKQIAAVRIHIERVIGRFREFKMLTPHSCLDHNLLNLMDCVLVIVCGIINVHHKLIK